MRALLLLIGFTGLMGIAAPAYAAELELLNISYDPTREFYEEYNALFQKHWQEKTGQAIRIKQSHGGSAKQARSVIEGLQADVVTLALGGDIDMIAEKSGAIAKDWPTKFPHDSVPSSSAVVFLVRKGNPKNIDDWDDLVKDGAQVITPNPKTSGGARWNYLAAYGYALKVNRHDKEKAFAYMQKLFANVPVLDTGARGATTSFVQRGLGDVLIAWENEAKLAQGKFPDKIEIVYPPLSIRADPPVAVVDKVVDKKGTRKAAEEYLRYLYSPEAQELAAKHHFLPCDKDIQNKHSSEFPEMQLLSIDDFGGWAAAQKEHFAEGGSFDQIYNPR